MKKFVLVFMAFLLCFALAPGMARAVGIGSPDDLSAGNDLSGTQIYFGNYNSASIKWHVVAKDATKATLWTTTNMGNMAYDSSHNGSGGSGSGAHEKWSGSDICAWLNGTFLTGAFTTAEQNAISAYGATETGTYAEIDISQKIVLPSVAEIGTGTGIGTWRIEYTGSNNDGRRGFGDRWWLRSPGAGLNNAAYVLLDGEVNGGGRFVTELLNVHPAFNLNLPSVIFTSAASGGKNVSAGNPLSAASPLTGAVKFTVLDSALSLTSVTPDSVNGREITFSYSGATTGKTLSAIVKDSAETVKYYGKLALNLSGASGTADVTAPDDFAVGTDKLYLFVEECNPDNETDFCSALAELTGFSEQTPPTGLTGVACTTSANNDGEITGTDATMEYIKVGGTTWTTCGTTETTGLASGTYLVRTKSDALVIASAPVSVTVDAYNNPGGGDIPGPGNNPGGGDNDPDSGKTTVTIDGATVDSVSISGSTVTITWLTEGKADTTYNLNLNSVTFTYGARQFTASLNANGGLVVTGDGELLPNGTIVVLTATNTTTTQAAAKNRAALLRKGASYALGEAKAVIANGKCVFTFPAEQISKLPEGTYDLTFATKSGANPAFNGTFAKGYIHRLSKPAAPEILLDASETASGGSVQVSATVTSGDAPQGGVNVTFTLNGADALTRTTGTDGKIAAFTLKSGLANGIYTVRASANGFAAVSRSVTVSNAPTGGGDDDEEEEKEEVEEKGGSGSGGCNAGMSFGLLLCGATLLFATGRRR